MWTDLLLQYGYIILFFAAVFEGDASLIAATFLAHEGYFRLPLVIVTAAVATCCANQLYYWISRRHAQSALERLRTHRIWGRFRKMLVRHAPGLLFFSRFLYGFRIAIPMVCGASGMSPGAFTATDVAGAALWSTLIGLAGFAIGHAIQVAASGVRHHELPIAVLLLCVTAAIKASRGRDWKGAAAAENLLGIRHDAPQ